MKINWKVRMKNKVFWLAIIPALLMLIQTVADVFGFVIDFGELSTKLLAMVESVFVVLAMLGIVADPTTSGVSDSDQAMTYTEPKM
ncbi:MAG: phage holin [Bacteroidaceae bacterium]|nr:phage holin [Bacteroidaceae bacterium]